jgi:hypothetical protein
MEMTSQYRQASDMRQVGQPREVYYQLPVVGRYKAEKTDVTTEEDAETGEYLHIANAQNCLDNDWSASISLALQEETDRSKSIFPS